MLVTLVLASALAAPRLTILPGAGYQVAHYDTLRSHLLFHDAVPDGGELCVAHSHAGAAALRELLSALPTRCQGGAVIMGCFEAGIVEKLPAPTLIIAGDLDGVSRFSEFAALRHRVLQSPRADGKQLSFAAIRGFSHHSFVPAALPLTDPSFAPSAPANLAALDLIPDVSAVDAAPRLAAIISDFARGGIRAALGEAERVASRLAAPIVAALELEGSTALGTPWCDSDWPTNPSCNYPKYPDFSLPFGPKPAPSPPLPANCICGSQWITTVASPLVSGVDQQPFNVNSSDAFHDVS